MTVGWSTDRAWVVVGIAALLFLSALPYGPDEVRGIPQCSTLVELDTGSGEQLAVCAEEVHELDTLLGKGCALPSGYSPLPGDRISAAPEAVACSVEIGRMSGMALLALGLPIDVNHASTRDLEALPGIGPVLARRIWERASERPFKDVDELIEVKGIGPVKLERIRDMLEAGIP